MTTMTTKHDEAQEPERINLNEMMAEGGPASAVAFHLINVDYHANIIATSGKQEDMSMLYDMLLHHLAYLHVELERDTVQTLEVPTPKLIVPSRQQRRQ